MLITRQLFMKLIVLSSPTSVHNEHQIVIQLFEAGLQWFHLRKPDFSDIDYAHYLAAIPTEYWSRVVLHHHHHLAVQLGLGGVHWTEKSRVGKRKEQLTTLAADYRAEGLQISAAVHDLNDLELLNDVCDYVLISPVFDSLSKKNYPANPNLDIQQWTSTTKVKLIALGGIQAATIPKALAKGFDGVAALGMIWNVPEKAVDNYEKLDQTLHKTNHTIPFVPRPYVLTIAGHDPSAGAGLTADLKTFEQWQTYGLSVCTALTVQTDTTFVSVDWVKKEAILAQMKVLLNRFEVGVVKIGLLEDWLILEKLLPLLKGKKIILDPILSASAGFDFHQLSDTKKLFQLLAQLTLLTPNRNELLELLPSKNAQTAAKKLSQYCAILLKGGHNEQAKGRDELWQNGELIAVFEAQQLAKVGKHGSGCVLSASIAAALAKGKDLETACQSGKNYTAQFLNSNDLLLGYHHLSNTNVESAFNSQS